MSRKSHAQLDREIAEALSPREGMRVVVTSSGARKHGLREGAHGLIARVSSPDARKGKPSSTARVLVSVHGAEFSTDWPTTSLRVAGKGEVDPRALPTSESSYIGGLRYKAGLKGSHATKKSSVTAEQFNALATRAAETLLGDDFEALLAAVRKLHPKTPIGVHAGHGHGPERIAEGLFIQLLETSPISAPWSRQVVVEEIVPHYRQGKAARRLEVSPYALRALPKTRFKRR